MQLLVFHLTHTIDLFIVSGQDSKVSITGDGTVSRNGKTSLNIHVEIDGLGPGGPGAGVGGLGVGGGAPGAGVGGPGIGGGAVGAGTGTKGLGGK